MRPDLSKFGGRLLERLDVLEEEQTGEFVQSVMRERKNGRT